MKKYLLLLSFFTCLSSFAQDSIAIQKQRYVITVSLSSPVFGYATRWNAGYMHRLAPRIWAGTDIGYGSGTSLPRFGMAYHVGDNCITPNYRFFEVCPEIYYDVVQSTPMEYMVSAEFFYMRHTDTYTDGYYNSMASVPQVKYASADYTRIKTGVNINFSSFIRFTNQVGMVIKVGGGLRERKVKYTNVVVQPTDNDNDNEYGLSTWKDAGKSLSINLNVDLRLYYRF